MAIDGVFLRHVVQELTTELANGRVDKVQQPSKEEIVLFFRTRNGVRKILISSRANSARVHVLEHVIPNPLSPPMFCMLLRKKLMGGKLLDILQPDLERVINFKFECTNDLGDKCIIYLICEIMGKYSNVILVDEKNMIIEALKRVNAQMSSKRLVLPGMTYDLPPRQEKLSLLEVSADEIVQKVLSDTKDVKLSKKVLSVIKGISPVVCNFVVNGIEDIHEDREKLYDRMQKLLQVTRDVSGYPCIVQDAKTNKKDITFISDGDSQIAESFSKLLDDFFYRKDTIDRIHAKSKDLYHRIATFKARLEKKVIQQRKEYEMCSKRDQYRIKADLLNANLYQLKGNHPSVSVQNFYEPDMPIIEIKCDPTIDVAANAQKFYKKYRKLKVAERILHDEIDKSYTQIQYLDSILDAIDRAETESDLEDIKHELTAQGYIKKKKTLKKPAKLNKNNFKEYISTEKFKILVGRNNVQNDYLTTKYAKKNDLWFHVKDTPGSHVVVVNDGRAFSDSVVMEAAKLAVQNSKARFSQNVPVDYTQIKNVSKPNAAVPGKVIYVSYNTVYVTANID